MIRIELNISSISLTALALFIFPLAPGILSIYLASHTYLNYFSDVQAPTAVCGAFLCTNTILLLSNALFPLRSPILVTQFLSIIGALATGSFYICKRINLSAESYSNYSPRQLAIESAFLILWIFSLCINSIFLTSAAIMYRGQMNFCKNGCFSSGIVEKQSMPFSVESTHTLVGKSDLDKTNSWKKSATAGDPCTVTTIQDHEAQFSSLSNSASLPELMENEKDSTITRFKRKHKAASSVLSFLQSPPATALLKPSIRASHVPDAKVTQSDIEGLGIPTGIQDSTAAFDTWDVQSRDRVQWTMAHIGIGENYRNVSANSSAGQSDISSTSYNRRISSAGFAKEYRKVRDSKDQSININRHKANRSIAQYDQEVLSNL